MNSNLAFFEQLLRRMTKFNKVHLYLHRSASQSSQHLLLDRVSNATSSGFLPPVSCTLHFRRLQIRCTLLQKTIEQPIHSILFSKPVGTLRAGDTLALTYAKNIPAWCSTINSLWPVSCNGDAADWRDICAEAGIDVRASTASTDSEEEDGKLIH